MEKRIGDELIGNCWLVSGIYELSQEKVWVFSSDYATGKVVWKFRETGTLVAYLDGREEYKAPFSIIGGKLYIDLSARKPDAEYSGYKESYMIVPKEDAIWLYDLEAKIEKNCWLALKLVPAAGQGGVIPSIPDGKVCPASK